MLACRDKARGEAAFARLPSELPHARLELHSLDLADLKSICAFAAALWDMSERLTGVRYELPGPSI